MPTSQENSVFCVQYANGDCYIQMGPAFLGKDGRWTEDMAEAWTTRDRAHADTVAQQHNAKVSR